MRSLTFADAINEATHQAMAQDSKVLCYGLGADDPKRIFGTTHQLQEAFGEQRVFDMPTSENAMTGIGVGVAIAGFRPVMMHQRLDFFLLAMDQLVNSAAKWHYMFGGQMNVPIVIRLVMGRGWGQGPTHSQNLQSWFAHIPGLKVVAPATAADAKGLLLSSIFDENPVVFLEHRWLHNSVSDVPELDYCTPLGTAKIVRPGRDVTLVGMSYMTVEALRAAKKLEALGISCEVIDLRTIRPIDWDTILTSVKKTGKLIALDCSMPTCSVASEIIATVSMAAFKDLTHAPIRIANPDNPEPTSFGLTKDYHPDANRIIQSVSEMLGVALEDSMLFSNQQNHMHDVPGDWFKGPF
ncbi:MAG: transketolase C-terminal domain-containing protein [Legionella sp.]|nr:transketolase C-terminal domain-containing protein [Legionella sp.]